MKDQISEKRIEKLHPKVRSDFKSFIEDAENSLGVTLRITQGLRTFEEQAELFSHGRTKFVDTKGNKLGIVTKAKPGQSFHQYGLAVDVVEIKDGKANWNFDYAKLKPFALKYGLSWGGDWKSFKDKPHFEKSDINGKHYNWKELLKRYNNGQTFNERAGSDIIKYVIL